jgi:hypothetical protein
VFIVLKGYEMSIEIIDDIEKEEGDRRCLYNVSKIMAIRYKNIILIIRKVIL